ncbi:hypothetical protein WE348_21080 (plasmid) [Alteromonas macleodii]|uniref:hypothetical protein n=1 Tax=Alteromonas macleodii TaxID=28108 RepID=UPI0030CD860A
MISYARRAYIKQTYSFFALKTLTLEEEQSEYLYKRCMILGEYLNQKNYLLEKPVSGKQSIQQPKRGRLLREEKIVFCSYHQFFL